MSGISYLLEDSVYGGKSLKETDKKRAQEMYKEVIAAIRKKKKEEARERRRRGKRSGTQNRTEKQK